MSTLGRYMVVSMSTLTLIDTLKKKILINEVFINKNVMKIRQGYVFNKSFVKY